MLIFFYFKGLVIGLLSSNILESKELFPRTPNGVVWDFESLALVIIEAINHVEESSLTHFEDLAVGALA